MGADVHNDNEAAGTKLYAFVSHESAVDAIWSLAARGWKGLLDDEGVWAVPSPESCVKSQGDLRRLADDVDLRSLGIRRCPLDLLVPNKSCYSRGRRARFHVWADSFPAHSFVRPHEQVLVSTPYFVVLQLAMARRADRLSRQDAESLAAEDALIRRELGIAGSGSTVSELLQWNNIARFVRAVQVLCDFMATYRYVPEGYGGDLGPSTGASVRYGTKPLVNPQAMERYIGEMGNAKGIMRAREVTRAAYAGSASPMETMLALMLTLPSTMGGFGLPHAQLNWEITPGKLELALASQEMMLADICWPESRVAIEYHGWREHFGSGPRKVGEDAARANSLTALGWKVFHVTFEQAKTVEGVSLLARQVARALDVELPRSSPTELVWRSRLLAMLLPKVGDEHV